ncbi:MAG TPA: HlyD family efflux transporter periplasmic adaptor subunit [Ideonella sp.]|uniref:HlyD family secretion protein n=1 Tax=Ideonella sp. TaxID=1929293 RepID=UPI002E340750|nr:HlyD family efflux transporter periplasmic adaptor subunit [Ideonella sp.]HEX5683621.1 HlyD family efflux transporter periplasmic adaptor subunit [Ideonella sp.]
MSDLFRVEAVDHQRQRFHGTVVLARPWSFAALTTLLAVLVLALLLFAWNFGFTRKEMVSGMVVPDRGLIRVVAPLAGRVSEVRVTAGDAVRAGDVMFMIRRDRATAAGTDQASISGALANRLRRLESEVAQQGRLAEMRVQEAGARARGLEASIEQLTRERGLQAQRVQVLRDIAQRHADLAREGMMTRLAAQTKAAEALEEEAKLASIDRGRLDAQRELATVRAQMAQIPLLSQREQSESRRDMDEVQQLLDESELQREVSVRAAHDGAVAAVLVDAGQAVKDEGELATLVPHGATLEAELYLPSRAVGNLHEGQAVQLRFEAYPFEKYGLFPGRLRTVSLSPVSSTELAAGLPPPPDAAGPARSLYRARVAVDLAALRSRTGNALPLKPGMLLSASVALEHRSLVEWALAPLLGVGKTL